jgi:hypothetical protein
LELAEILNDGFRNAMMHSFTLHSGEYGLTLVSPGPEQAVLLPRASDPKHVLVSIEGLFMTFVRAVRMFEHQVRTEGDAQRRFAAVFDKYGSIRFLTGTPV